MKYPYGCVEQTTGGTLPLLALGALRDGFALPGLDPEAIRVRAQAGIDRLLSMQTWSGGLSYWPGESAPHPWGSAYGGLALVRASHTPGLKVPDQAIDALREYLREILRGQAATARESWHQELDAVKPFAAYVLALSGAPEPSFNVALFEARADLPDFAKLLLALAIQEAEGAPTQVATLLDEVQAHVQSDARSATLERQDDRYWYATMDSDVRATALLAMTLQEVRPRDALLPKVQRALLDARRGGRWLNTQDNAFAVLALAKTLLSSEAPGAKSTARVLIGGKLVFEEDLASDDLAPKTLHIPMALVRAASGQVLTVERGGDAAPLYYTLRLAYAPSETPRAEARHGFELARSYRIASGPRAGEPATEVKAGDLIRVDLAVRTASTRRYVAVDDPLPAGFEPITLDFASSRGDLEALLDDASDDGWRWYMRTFNHKEQRDDRIVAFADEMEAGAHTFSYLARATTSGRFVAPAARV
ncbi:MAG: hypothetical protein KDK70_40650, partial [Myxococcales bacterium]|nr:hypothetical protein [Myxococcales bacterium]